VKWMKIIEIDESFLQCVFLLTLVMQHYLIALMLFFNNMLFSTKLERSLSFLNKIKT